MLQIIDLNVVTREDQLVPIIQDCLRHHSAFLLKNYANMDAVQALLTVLKEEKPNALQGFDRSFSGAESLEGGVSVEQYVGRPDSLGLRNSNIGKLTSRLIRISTFFAKACLESAGGANAISAALDDARNCCVKFTRFYRSTSNSILDLNFDYEDEYRLHGSPGIISVFPVAQGIKYKVNDGWKVIEEPDCILVQTGSLLSAFSNNKTHAAEEIKFPTSCVMHFTIFPSLQTTVFGSKTVFDILLGSQIRDFPDVTSKLYPREFSINALIAKVDFCKNIFNVTDSVLSLYSISRSLMTSAPELHTLLPQISNMLKRKVSQDDFLRMMSIWDEAYALEFNNSFEITIRPPSSGIMNHLSNKSRKLNYTEKANEWLLQATQAEHIPLNVPILSVRKRRGSDSLGETSENYNNASDGNDATGPSSGRKLATLKKNRSRGYISNTKEKFMFKEETSNGDVPLLERIREKERRAAALLSQRERHHEQFLNVKTYQIFNILFSLPQNKPYTITHLTSLIIDSLSDSNNPIGENETHQVLLRLQNILPDRIHMIEAEGDLKVFRWTDLDRALLKERMGYMA
ncbi:LAFA_0E02124g1_1 [Lachancea sp. 'fantastica']|nr:LAFA_0E02124g1_1 [Lachancea sp. 'fantastica']